MNGIGSCSPRYRKHPSDPFPAGECTYPECSRRQYADGLCKKHRDEADYRAGRLDETVRSRSEADEIVDRGVDAVRTHRDIIL